MGFLLTPLPHVLSLEELTRFMLYTTRKLQKSVYTPKRQLGYKTAMASHAVVFRGVLSGPPPPVYREGNTTPLKMTAWEAISEGKKNSPWDSGRFELSRVRVVECKITVNVWSKSRGNQFWFELAGVNGVFMSVSPRGVSVQGWFLHVSSTVFDEIVTIFPEFVQTSQWSFGHRDATKVN